MRRICTAVTTGVFLFLLGAGTASAVTPQLAWTRSFNGPASEQEGVHDVAVRDGFLYVTGYTSLTNFTKGYVTVKYAPDGTVAWSRIYEGVVGHANEDDRAFAIAVDAAHNVYVAGYSIDHRIVDDREYIFADLATLKYSPTGELLWERRFRSSGGNAQPSAIAVDAEGSAYLTGFAFNDNNHEDFLTAKFTGAGNLAWTAAWSAPEDGSDLGYHVRVGSEGRVYVVGDSWRGFAPYYDITSVVYSQSGELLGVDPPPGRTSGFESLGPNPVLAGRLVTLHAPGTSPVEVFDVDGRRVLRLAADGSSPANRGLQFRAPSSPGIYVVRAGHQTRKLVVVGN